MANSEGSVGQAPAAWVWSHYRGVITETRTSDPAPADALEAPVTRAPVIHTPVTHAPAAEERPTASVAAGPTEDKNNALIGVGVAAAVLVIAGLTWLFTTQPASSPAPAEAVPAASENAPAKSEVAPTVAAPIQAPAQVPSQAPAAAAPPAAPAAAKAPAPAAHDRPVKKKKR